MIISVIAKDRCRSSASRSGQYFGQIFVLIPQAPEQTPVLLTISINYNDDDDVLIHVQSHALSAIQQLQQCAIVFRNVLASNRISDVEEAKYNSLICCEDFLWTKKQQAIFGGMVAFR